MTNETGTDRQARADVTLEPGRALSEPMLARLVGELADAVIVADPSGTIVFWNAAATRVFGFSRDEAIGAALDLIIPERLRARHDAGYRETMRTGHTKYGDQLLEVPALHRDGRTLSIAFTVTLLFDATGSVPVAIAAVIRDDTERWQERRRLRAEITASRAGSNGPTADG